MINLNFKSEKTEDLLIAKVLEDNDTYIIEYLLDGSWNIHDRFSTYKDTLLHQAVFNQKIKCTRALLLYGADPNLKDRNGYSSLALAAEKGDDELVNVILKESTIPLLSETLDDLALKSIPPFLKKGLQNKFNNIENSIEKYRAQVYPVKDIEIAKKPIIQQYNNVIESKQKVEQKNAEQKNEKLDAFLNQFNTYPDNFICPLTYEVMDDPVITPAGITYNRDVAEAWIRKNGTEPTVHSIKMTVDQLYPNLALKAVIDNHKLLQKMANELINPEPIIRNNSNGSKL